MIRVSVVRLKLVQREVHLVPSSLYLEMRRDAFKWKKTQPTPTTSHHVDIFPSRPSSTALDPDPIARCVLFDVRCPRSNLQYRRSGTMMSKRETGGSRIVICSKPKPCSFYLFRAHVVGECCSVVNLLVSRCLSYIVLLLLLLSFLLLPCSPVLLLLLVETSCFASTNNAIPE